MTFWFFTSKASDFGKKLVLTKKILPNSIENILKNYKPQINNIKDAEKHFLTFLEQSGNSIAKKTALTTLNGMSLLGMIAGSILSVNIITPLIRNKIASKFQQNKIKSEINQNNLLLYNKLKQFC